MDQRLRATYRIETAHPLDEAAAIMAGEQSTGTFVRVPGETQALTDRYGARVELVRELEEVHAPSLPGSKLPKGRDTGVRRRAEVVLSFPQATIGTSLTGLWTAIAGNLFELSPFSGLRLIDLQLPDSFISAQPGPAFGVAGTRELADVSGRPLIGTIIKPSVGLTPDETAGSVAALCSAGLDFIKDDELQSDAPSSPFQTRLEAVMRVLDAHADATGKRVMYAFNVTGDPESMLRKHDLVRAAGGTCVMVNLLAVGLAGVEFLRRHADLPIHGHRAGWGMFSRAPMLGMDYPVASALFRMAGADHLHVNGLRNKFCEDDASVIRSATACLTPLTELNPMRAMPVFSSGQWAGQAPDTYRALGSVDLIYLAGGGILAHPDGPGAGVASIRQAWEAALTGVSLQESARSNPELARAIERFGPV